MERSKKKNQSRKKDQDNLSDVWADDIQAVLVSDMHLSHSPPIARAGEPDWYKVMGTHLLELNVLRLQCDAPIIIAGDVFHKWNSPSELVNFAIDMMPENSYAIPGQHDMPHHSMEDIHRSSYSTLTRTEIIEDLKWKTPTKFGKSGEWMAYGIPWGCEQYLSNLLTSKSFRKTANNYRILLVIHSMCYRDGHLPYPDVSKTASASGWAQRLGSKITVAHFGDNHQQFQANFDDLRIVNCGSFLQRNRGDKLPKVALLHNDGDISWHRMAAADDAIFNDDDMAMYSINTNEVVEFVDQLLSNWVSSADFSGNLQRELKSADRKLREFAAKVLE